MKKFFILLAVVLGIAGVLTFSSIRESQPPEVKKYNVQFMCIPLQEWNCQVAARGKLDSGHLIIADGWDVSSYHLASPSGIKPVSEEMSEKLKRGQYGPYIIVSCSAQPEGKKSAPIDHIVPAENCLKLILGKGVRPH